MSVNFESINDTYPLASDDTVKVAVSFVCAPLSKVTAADISEFYAKEQPVGAVLDVTEGWTDSLTLGLAFSCSYVATINPKPGVTAGDLRAAMYRAIAAANATHVIQSDEVLVGTIERATTSIIPSIIANGPSTKTTVSLVALAAIAIVVLLIFVKFE